MHCRRLVETRNRYHSAPELGVFEFNPPPPDQFYLLENLHWWPEKSYSESREADLLHNYQPLQQRRWETVEKFLMDETLSWRARSRSSPPLRSNTATGLSQGLCEGEQDMQRGQIYKVCSTGCIAGGKTIYFDERKFKTLKPRYCYRESKQINRSKESKEPEPMENLQQKMETVSVDEELDKHSLLRILEILSPNDRSASCPFLEVRSDQPVENDSTAEIIKQLEMAAIRIRASRVSESRNRSMLMDDCRRLKWELDKKTETIINLHRKINQMTEATGNKATAEPPNRSNVPIITNLRAEVDFLRSELAAARNAIRRSEETIDFLNKETVSREYFTSGLERAILMVKETLVEKEMKNTILKKQLVDAKKIINSLMKNASSDDSGKKMSNKFDIMIRSYMDSVDTIKSYACNFEGKNFSENFTDLNAMIHKLEGELKCERDVDTLLSEFEEKKTKYGKVFRRSAAVLNPKDVEHKLYSCIGSNFTLNELCAMYMNIADSGSGEIRPDQYEHLAGLLKYESQFFELYLEVARNTLVYELMCLIQNQKIVGELKVKKFDVEVPKATVENDKDNKDEGKEDDKSKDKANLGSSKRSILKQLKSFYK